MYWRPTPTKTDISNALLGPRRPLAWDKLCSLLITTSADPRPLVNHLAAMGDLHRAGRFDWMSDDVLTLTGQRPLSVQEFVRKNAAAFTAAAKAKEA